MSHDYGSDLYTEAEGGEDGLAPLGVADRDDLVDHVDRNTLRRIAQPSPNPLGAARWT